MKVHSSSIPQDFTTWFFAGVLGFSCAATLEWALVVGPASASATGFAAGWALFLSLWLLAGSAWSLATALVLWSATGRPTPAPLFARARSHLHRWWQERGTEKDLRRLAHLLSWPLALFAFFGASIAVTTHLIATRNEPFFIALFSLGFQLLATLLLFLAGLSLARGLHALFGKLRPAWPARVNAVALLALFACLGLACTLVALVLFWETFHALEGPAFLLLLFAVSLQLLFLRLAKKARLLQRPALMLATLVVPVLSVLAIGLTSQNSDARRMVILHGHSADFGFTFVQRHLDLDRFFRRSDCPPLGPDGLPVDGTSNEDFEAQCLDPAYDRPFHRIEVPPFERPELSEPPSFLFITWDSVRVDRLSFMGHDRDTTPNLARLAEESLVFERAFAQDSGTGPSFWSLMAGKTPFQVRLHDAGRFPPRIDDEEPMLGQLLYSAGYNTEAVMCGSVFDRPRWEGIRRGFQRFDNVCGRDLQHLAPRVAHEAVPTLERLAEQEEPFFLWVHFYDPHHPYNAHPEIGFGDGVLARYDEELRYTDHYTQQLLEAAFAVGKHRPLYTIVSADHGENFNEHGSDPHARNLYRIVTQVPKIVHGPHITPGRVEAPVALNDVYPTVLDLAALAIPEESTMVSQLPVLFGAEPDAHRMVFQENSYSRPRRHTRAVIFDRYHYIMDLTTNVNELYDYVDDPLERRNLIGAGLPEERILRQALIRFLKTSEIPEGLRE